MLIKRILTAVVAIPIALAAIIWLPPVVFAALVATLLLVGAWEWSRLIGLTQLWPRVVYLFVVALGIFLSALTQVVPVLFTALIIWLWAFVAIVNYQRQGHGAGFQFPIVRSIIGFVVLIAAWVSIVTLRVQTQFGSEWLILVLLLIWSADIGGYFAGRFFGKKSLCSRVSPKKTWAGFFGGLILTIIVAAIYGLFLPLTQEKYFALLGLSLITALFSVVGDLAVSLLKRMSNIKDSGGFFPGHGGVLDRLDSVAAATIIFVIFSYWMGF